VIGDWWLVIGDWWLVISRKSFFSAMSASLREKFIFIRPIRVISILFLQMLFRYSAKKLPITNHQLPITINFELSLN
jgi:hypothetical protein